MSDTITVTIAPELDRVRILATTPTHDVLKAVLGPVRGAHPRAAATLLEGIAFDQLRRRRLSGLRCSHFSGNRRACWFVFSRRLTFGRHRVAAIFALIHDDPRPETVLRLQRLHGQASFFPDAASSLTSTWHPALLRAAVF